MEMTSEIIIVCLLVSLYAMVFGVIHYICEQLQYRLCGVSFLYKVIALTPHTIVC